MLKNLFKSFFAILIVTATSQLMAESDGEMNTVNQAQSELTTPANKLVPLNEQEIQQFKDSCTAEDNALLQKFAQSLSECFEAFKANSTYTELEKMCADKGFSLQIILSIIPCKLVAEEIENN